MLQGLHGLAPGCSPGPDPPLVTIFCIAIADLYPITHAGHITSYLVSKNLIGSWHASANLAANPPKIDDAQVTEE